MIINLIWRFVWAFLGNRYARWRAILPYGAGYWGALRGYATAFVAGEPHQYVGHNPAARIGIALLLLLLLVQTATGLILAGTDLFWPPFGGWFAGWVAATGVDPATVSPLARNTIDQAAYQAMRGFRSPVVIIHLYGFYALAGVILAHVFAVIVTELREGGSITSAMFTGRKILNRPPQDE
jgi:cytochrome b